MKIFKDFMFLAKHRTIEVVIIFVTFALFILLIAGAIWDMANSDGIPQGSYQDGQYESPFGLIIGFDGSIGYGYRFGESNMGMKLIDFTRYDNDYSFDIGVMP